LQIPFFCDLRRTLPACTTDRFLAAFVAALALCWSPVAAAGIVSVAHPPVGAIGLQTSYLQEQGSRLGINDAIAAYRAGSYKTGHAPVLDFGIGARPVWIHFAVANQTGDPLLRRLTIEPSWLDKVDVYFRSGNDIVAAYNLGDGQIFAHRPVNSRFFAIDHEFGAGISEVFIRVETSDPMVAAIFMRTIDDAAAFDERQSYSYGFVYGYLLALLAYNAMLYIGLRSRRYILYAIYLGSFVLLNIAYTGHGFAWLWPDSVGLQLWIIPFMMVSCGISGLLFAVSFLATRANFPRTHRAVIWICTMFAALLLVSFMLDYNAFGLDVAFVFISVFSCLMILLGVLAVRSGHKPARYFLFGAIAAMTGVLLTDLSVAGLIPYNAFTYRSAEFGMLIDATVLALALAYQFRVGQQEKFQAERMAKVDPLTGLNNRRAFYQITKPVWSTALRKRREASVIMLDIDRFKQVNDKHGHACGDEVLIAVAAILAKSARDGDVQARWGGEEFILFLPETNLEEAVTMAERLRLAISELRIPYQSEMISFTASFGVAQKTASDVALDELISVADECLYRSKRDGRNRVSSTILP
jgi:two-component system, sensor histidine kinase LadS